MSISQPRLLCAARASARGSAPGEGRSIELLDVELGAAVQRAAFGALVGGDGVARSPPHRAEARGRDAAIEERPEHAVGARLAEAQVVLRGSGGVAVHLDPKLRHLGPAREVVDDGLEHCLVVGCVGQLGGVGREGEAPPELEPVPDDRDREQRRRGRGGRRRLGLGGWSAQRRRWLLDDDGVLFGGAGGEGEEEEERAARHRRRIYPDARRKLPRAG